MKIRILTQRAHVMDSELKWATNVLLLKTTLLLYKKYALILTISVGGMTAVSIVDAMGLTPRCGFDSPVGSIWDTHFL